MRENWTLGTYEAVETELDRSPECDGLGTQLYGSRLVAAARAAAAMHMAESARIGGDRGGAPGRGQLEASAFDEGVRYAEFAALLGLTGPERAA